MKLVNFPILDLRWWLWFIAAMPHDLGMIEAIDQNIKLSLPPTDPNHHTMSDMFDLIWMFVILQCGWPI